MKLVRIVAVTIGFATVLRAQSPATEQEWRSELAKTRDQYTSAKSFKWASLVLAGGGGALIVIGAFHDQVCIVGPGTGASSFAGHPLCDQYAYRTDWRLLGPGLGLAGTGVTLTEIFAIRESKAARRIKDLDSIGRQRHWSVSVQPTTVNIAFSW